MNVNRGIGRKVYAGRCVCAFEWKGVRADLLTWGRDSSQTY